MASSVSKNISLRIMSLKGDGPYIRFWALPNQMVDRMGSIENYIKNREHELEGCAGFMDSCQTPIGMRVLAKSILRRQWCRGLILAAAGASKVVVQLIDYGNQETLSVTDIRQDIDPFLQSHAPLSVECILADVLPLDGVSWPPSILRFCEYHLINQTVEGCVITDVNKVPVLRIAKTGKNESFAQLLINNGSAVIKKYDPGPVSTSPTPYQGQFTTAHYKPVVFDKSKEHLVKVSYVEEPSKFFVKLSVAELELNRLMEVIKAWAAYGKLVPLQVSNYPTPCLACCGNKHTFYRALVIKRYNQNTCNVFFVDYGNSEDKNMMELKAIPPEFMELPAQAIGCMLPRHANIDKDTFIRMTSKKDLKCKVIDFVEDLYVVSLQDEMGQDLFMSSYPNRPITSSFASQKHLTYKRQKLSIGMTTDVIVSYSNDLDEFYCNLLSLKHQQNAISSILNGRNVSQPISFRECVPNTPVCVMYSGDNLWYRGEIINMKSDSHIEVLFVDFGNCEVATLQSLRRMPDELLEFPIQAYRCHLFETVLPPNQEVKDKAFNLFVGWTTDKPMSATVNNILEDMSYGITLCELHSTTSFNSKLELMFTMITPPNLSGIEKLYITHFESPTAFFGQLESINSELLTQMQDEINDDYKEISNANFRPDVSRLVSAKFSDGLFYRAKVEAVDRQSCKVFFLDFGNRQSLQISDVWPLKSQFYRYPQFGIECALSNCSPNVPIEKLKSLLCDNSIQVKLLKKENEKWIVSLTDDFWGNVTILEMMRQHESAAPVANYGANVNAKMDSDYLIGNYNTDTFGKTNFSSSMNPDKSRQWKQPTMEDLAMHSKVPVSSNKSERREYEEISIPHMATRNGFVSHVNSPSDFCCQIEEESSKLEALMDEIDGVYGNLNENELTFDTYLIGAPCCAIFSADDSWYRGKIKGVNTKNNPKTCDVAFVDYGNSETVPVSKVKKLRPDLLQLPTQAVHCKLSGVSPKSGEWSEQEINGFINKALEKSFIVQFIEKDSNNIYAVKLISTEKLQDAMLNDFNASPAKKPVKVETSPLSSVVVSSTLKLKGMMVKIGTTESVEVTFASSPIEIFCQLLSKANEFQKMMQDMQKKYAMMSETEDLVEEPKQGMLCVAQFSLDRAWYRAEIQDIVPSGITVVYVDYGNSEMVNRKKIKYILQEFTMLPIQAVKCHLKGIRETDDSQVTNQNGSKYFEGDLRCRFVSKEQDFYLVDVTCNLRNVAQELVKAGLATSEEVPAKKPVEPTPAIKPPAQNASTTKALPKRDTPFVSGQLLSVIVSFVKSPVQFWCQIVEEADSLEQLMADIKSKSGTFQEILNGLRVGETCLAKFSEDGEWYRAKIKSHPSEDSYEVFFVDYGNSETLNISEISTIPPEFAELPPQCVECQLYGIPKEITSGKASEFETVSTEVDELTAKVEQFDNGVCVVSLLYEKDGEEINVTESLFGESAVYTDVSKTGETKFPPVEVPLGLHQGYVASVVTPLDFTVQLGSNEDQINDLLCQLAELYKPLEDTQDQAVENPCIGMACCAKFSEDDEWYRAEIQSISDGNAQVYFVDYGNTAVVPQQCLKSLDDALLLIPPYGIKCKLHGVASIDGTWTEDAIATFDEMVSGPLLNVTFVSKDTPAAVNLSKDDKDIAQALIDMEVAIVDTSRELDEAYVDDHFNKEPISDVEYTTYPERETGVSYKAKMGHVESYNMFYIVPSELNAELDMIITTLETIYTNATEDDFKLEEITESMPCVAKFTEDDAWYRAVVTGVDGNNIFVRFVDYGNSEVTTTDRLKALTPQLLRIPPTAIQCHLSGIQVVDGKEQNIVSQLKDLLDQDIEFEIEVCTDKPYGVKLSTDHDIAQTLINMEAAIVDTSHKVDETCIDNHFKKEPISDAEYATYPDRKTSISFKAKMGHVESYNVFYIIPSELNSELDTIVTSLETVYINATEDDFKLEKITESMPCVAKFTEDDAWYRAIVTGLDGDNIFVRFIDYGNSEVTSIDRLKALTPQLLQIPPIAVQCHLFGIQAIEGKEQDIILKLTDLIDQDIEFDIEMCTSKPYGVKLCSDHDFATSCVEDSLAENVSEPTSSTIQNSETFKDNLRIAFVDEPIEKKVIQKRCCSESEMSGNVKFVQIVEGCITVHVVGEVLEEALENQQEKLQSTYSGDGNQLQDVKVGDFCVANYSEDDCWYRAQVQAEATDQTFNVVFVDYGNSGIVSKENMKELLLEFTTEPQFAIQVCLAGHKAVKDKSEDLQVALEEYLYDGATTFKICSESHYSVHGMCATEITCSELDIISSLIEKQLIQPCYVLPAFGNRFKATLEKIDHSNMVFYVAPIGTDVNREKLQEAMNQELSDVEGSEMEEVSLFELYSTKDGDSWCRLYIDNTKDDIVATFVDFGKTAVVKATDILPLPKSMHHKPLCVMPCTANEMPEDTEGVVVYVEVKRVVENCLEVNLLSETEVQVQEVLSETIEKVETNQCEGENTADLFNETDDDKTKETVEVEDNEYLNETDDGKAGTEEEIYELVEEADMSTVEVQEMLDEMADKFEEYPPQETEEFGAEYGVGDTDDGYLVDLSQYKTTVEEEIFVLTEEVNYEAEETAVNVCEESIDKYDHQETGEVYDEDLSMNKNDARDLASVTIEKTTDDEVVDQSHDHNTEEGEIFEVVEEAVFVSDNVCDKTVVKHEELQITYEMNAQNVDSSKEEAIFEEHETSENVCDETAAKYEQLQETDEMNIRNVESVFEESEISENVCAETAAKYEQLQATDEMNIRNVESIKKESVFEESEISENVCDETTAKYEQLQETDEMNIRNVDSIKKESVFEESVCDETAAKYELQETDEMNASVDFNEEVVFVGHGTSSDVCEETVAEKLHETTKDEFNDKIHNKHVEDDATTHDNTSTLQKVEGNVENLKTSMDSIASDVYLKKPDNEIFNGKSEDFCNENKVTETLYLYEDMEIESNLEGGGIDEEFHDENFNIQEQETSDVRKKEDGNVDNDNMQVMDDHAKANEDMKDVAGSIEKLQNTERSSKVEQIQSSLEVKSNDIENNVEEYEEETYDKENIQPSPPQQCGDASVGSINEDTSDAEIEENVNTDLDCTQIYLSGIETVIVSEIVITEGSILLAVVPLKVHQKLNTLDTDLQNSYSENDIPLEADSSSQFCAVKSDGKWYRGEVLGSSEDSLTVLCIDHGFCVTVDSNSAKHLKPEHRSVPPCAIWCTLLSAQCLPDMKEATKEHLTTLLVGKQVCIKIVNSGVPYKVAVFVDDQNILSQLLSKNLLIQVLPSVYIKTGTYNAKISYLNVEVGEVEINVILSVHAHKIELLKEKMLDAYEIGKNEVILCKSSLYAVYHNSTWLRCVIVDEITCSVKLLDLGEIIETQAEFLQLLLPEHCLETAYSMRCFLPDVNISGSENEIIKAFEKFRSSEVSVTVEENPETIEMSSVLTDEAAIRHLEASGNFSFKSLDGINLTKPDSTFQVQESTKSKECVSENKEQLVGFLNESYAVQTACSSTSVSTK